MGGREGGREGASNISPEPRAEECVSVTLHADTPSNPSAPPPPSLFCSYPPFPRDPHLRCVLVLLPAGVPPQLAVAVGQVHQHVAVVALHPGLLVQVGDVKLAAGGVGQHLVVLLQDLVHALQGVGPQGDGRGQS